MSAARESVKHLLRAVSSNSCRCPAHSHQHVAPASKSFGAQATQATEKEYAFEMACSNIRYGPGVSKEVGMDFANLQAKNVCVMTDPNITKLPVMNVVMDSLTKSNINYKVFDEVRVEPTDSSFQKAIDFAKDGQFDAYLAVGGGSTIDTCKAANLYATDPDAELLDYVNPPLGKGKPVLHQLKPLIAIPTTSGTGSETTGVAVFDYEPKKYKTGIANRAIRPLLGIVDPMVTMTMPERVLVNSGFDVLCHALESFTALPFDERTPRPADPKFRPAYQGSNPISDVWAKHALIIHEKYFKRAMVDPEDFEARSNMHLASCIAGIGFGNAGVHLCHAMSYPISGNVKKFICDDYPDKPLVPHGLSVCLTAPAVFKFTYAMCPDRHIEAAGLLGADITNAKREDAGLILSDQVRKIMQTMKIPNGLKSVGYTNSDIPGLVEGTIPQHRLTYLSPRPQTAEDLATMLEESMTIY